MALDFPTSPSPNQVYTAGAKSWSWDNTSGAWLAVNAGIQGTQGTQGTLGTQGAQGLQGITGANGSNGSQGTQGIQGIQGRQGITGAQGTQGTQGIQGIQGTAGFVGSNGAQGTQGQQGIQGIQGITGSQGITGAQGITGTNGTQGAQGTVGSTGAQGITGTQGAQGLQGIQGIQGTQGTQGIQGIQGITGLAFTIAKTYVSVAALTADTAPTNIVSGQFALINTSNVQDADNSKLYLWNGSIYIFQNDLSGTAGIQGITGSTGAQGTQGTQGIQGLQGIQGIQGRQGITGAQGITGTTGAQGTVGTTGAQGITGTQGAVGTQGITGTTGAQGTIGTSVTGAQGTTGASILGTANTFSQNNIFSSRLSVGAATYIGAIKTGALELGDIGQNYLYTGGWGGSNGAGILVNCADQWEINIHDSGTRVVSPLAFYGGGSNYIMMGRDIGWGTTYVETAQSFRAPIFYDSGNTGYYTDPASTSNLLGLTVANTITGSISGNAATVTNGVYQNTTPTLTGLSFGGNNPHVRIRHLDGKAPSTDTDDTLYLNYSNGAAVTINGNTAYHTGNIPTWNQNTTGSSGSCTGNAATATLAANSTLAGGLAIHSGTNNEANKIVRTEGNGYCNFGWINSASGDNGTTAITRITASHDAYLRYYTPANFATAAKLVTQMDGTRDTTNYNSRLTSGFYNSEGSPTNSVGTGYAQLIVAKGNDTGWQLAGGYANNTIYTRGWHSSGTFYQWYTLLSDGNYNSYSPTLTGGNASGTWGINVTGSSASCSGNAATATSASSATFLNSSNYINRCGSSGNANSDFNNTPAGTVRHNGDDANLTNSPGATWWFYDNYRHSNGSNYWGTQVAWGWEDNSYRLCQRNVSGGTWSGWVEYLSTSGRTFSGSLTMSANITAYSDISLKEDIQIIPDALNRLKTLRGVTFTRNDLEDKTKRHTGIIAQEVEVVLPEAVLTDEKGIKSVAYGNMAGLLIEAIKEQQQQIEKQQSQIDELKLLVQSITNK